MYIFGYHYNQSFYDVYDYNWSVRDPLPGQPAPLVLPVGWNTDEKTIAPIGADRSPPWHQISVSERRYNNKLESRVTNATWENVPIDPSPGGDTINLYNSGKPITWPISETHLASTQHYVSWSGNRIN